MATRTFQDRDGTGWLVWEVFPGEQLDAPVRGGTLLPPDLADGWLAFESEGEKRRLYPIPPRWLEYPDDSLEALCRAAEWVRPERASAA
jgi:hypothetical protein